MDRPLPARVALINRPVGLLRSLAMARRNVLSIIPELAVKQPMVSGKMGKRWHMVMDPTAIREIQVLQILTSENGWMTIPSRK